MKKNTDGSGAGKTNVCRLLEQKKINYRYYNYENSGAVSGMDVAAALGQDPARAFKTLVTVGKSGQHYVFVIPVCRELNLKKAAAAVGEKNIEMIKAKELLPLTGYIHGGCSPIGMKKFFRTTVDATAEAHDTIYFSAGKIGHSVEVAPGDLSRIIPVTFQDVTDEA